MNEEKTLLNDKTVIFHERLKPIIEYYREDAEKTDFGALMFAVFEYSMYGEHTDFKDRSLRRDYMALCSAVDLGRESSQKYQTEQIIKSNMRYAKDENDMRARLERKGLSEEDIQNGVDRYKAKQNKDAGINERGQFDKDTDWNAVDHYRRQAGLI